MGGKLLIATLVALCGLSTPAWGCGLLVSDSGGGEVDGFTALLSHDGTTEELVVAMGYDGGDPHGFGWMMAFPAPPTIDKADDELLVAALEASAPPDRRDHVPSALPLLCACSAGSDAEGVTELGRTRVDDLELVTIRGTGIGPIANWFDDNGFRFHDRQRDAIQSYVDRDWVLVAARVRRGAPEEARLSPVRFRFPTEEPVYPLALAGSEHPGALPMTLVTLTPYRPALTTLPHQVTRPDPDAVFPALGHAAQLRFSDRVDETIRDRFAPSIDVPADAWLSRFEAEWDTSRLREDLVLGQAESQTPVNYDALLAKYRSDRWWAIAGRVFFTWLLVTPVILLLAGFVALLTALTGGFRKRRDA